MIDLVAINRRLANRQFLSGPSDESFFSHLTCQIQGLTRPGEKLALPDFNEADAWKKAWSLYTALQIRAPDKQAVEAAESGMTVASAHRLMGRCADDIAALQVFRDGNRALWSVLCEFVGFDERDLTPPPADERYGVAEGWQERAQRIAGALARLQGLSDQERRDAPRKVEERRRLAILKAHDTGITNLHAAIVALAQRLEAIESRLPPQKEVTSAVAA